MSRAEEAPAPHLEPEHQRKPRPRGPVASAVRMQAQAGANIHAVAPVAKIYGRKTLKWGLRVVAFVVMMILYLAWKEAAAKSGMEGGAMGVVRGVVILGGYLAFVKWTKALDTKPDIAAESKQGEMSERDKRMLELSKKAKGHAKIAGR